MNATVINITSTPVWTSREWAEYRLLEDLIDQELLTQPQPVRVAGPPACTPRVLDTLRAAYRRRGWMTTVERHSFGRYLIIQRPT